MIPAMAFGVLAILAIAYMYGKRERARLGELHLPTDDIDHSIATNSQGRELSGRIGMCKAAANCTPIADLIMRHMFHRSRQHRHCALQLAS